MASHVHLIFRAKENNTDVLLGRIEKRTSKQIIMATKENNQESRKEWILWMFEQAALKSSNVKGNQFWQHNNNPIEMWSAEVIEQKADYIHHNPVVAGFVNEAWHWRYCSAIDYSGGKGLLEIEHL